MMNLMVNLMNGVEISKDVHFGWVITQQEIWAAFGVAALVTGIIIGIVGTKVVYRIKNSKKVMNEVVIGE